MSETAILQPLFEPRSVAIIGASTKPGKVGHDILRNMLSSGFAGDVYPVNPHADEILGKKCYPSVLEIPGDIDLAVIVVPAAVVLSVVEECGNKGVNAAIVISAGFKEAGPEGVQRERRLAELAREWGLRVVGPNCLGIMSTSNGLNASFAPGMPRRGNVGLMSQSGALATAIIDWSIQQGVGYSKFVSFGNGVDVGVVDLLRAWEDDEETTVIVAYIEGLPDGPEFMEVARQVSMKKPVVVVKSGSTQAGARAVSSHTGSLAGSEQAYNAAFMQSGVIRAHSVEDLFDLAIAFSYQGPPPGRSVGIVTNAGGPGIMATDAVERVDLRLAGLDPRTVRSLRKQLPEASNFYNPVDVLGDADAQRYAFAAENLLRDPNVDSVIAVLTPQAMTQPNETAERLAFVAAQSKKPVLACFMGGDAMAEATDLLNERRVPTYLYPERAVQALAKMAQYREWREEPPDEPALLRADTKTIRALFEHARSEGRVNLGETEARQVLQAYQVAIPESHVAQSAEEAANFAEKIGFPVVMKIISPDILHKSDIGGVRLGIRDRQEAMDAYELMMLRVHRYAPEAALRGVFVQEMVQSGREVIVGSTRDPQFGPLVMFGLGGIYVEVLKDVSFRVAPFGEKHARRMIDEIRSAPLLRGARGERPSDIDAIANTLLVVSQMVTDFPEIVEMDINPLKVGEAGAGAVAVDARITITEE
ncbi:MAG TPA: acetate--CoA ligase family protein [Armatimonadota bacterium]|nr:acetate--CoA ligase family protein [Armatimonadota bacterium]